MLFLLGQRVRMLTSKKSEEKFLQSFVIHLPGGTPQFLGSVSTGLLNGRDLTIGGKTTSVQSFFRILLRRIGWFTQYFAEAVDQGIQIVQDEVPASPTCFLVESKSSPGLIGLKNLAG